VHYREQGAESRVQRAGCREQSASLTHTARVKLTYGKSNVKNIVSLSQKKPSCVTVS